MCAYNHVSNDQENSQLNKIIPNELEYACNCVVLRMAIVTALGNIWLCALPKKSTYCQKCIWTSSVYL